MSKRSRNRRIQGNGRRRNGTGSRSWSARLTSGLGWGALLGVLAVLGLVGWYWTSNVTVGRVAVDGTDRAETDEIRELAAVEPGTRLYGLDAAAVSERVRSHPWVREVDVDRIPTGLLQIEITERAPAGLVIDGAGRPAYYLDDRAHAMPLVGEPVADLPLVRGLPPSIEAYDYRARTDLGALLGTLAARGSAHPLVSAVRLGGPDGPVAEVGPDPSGRSVDVVLGRGSYSEKLTRLEAFWTQRVQGADRTFRRIDLRFDGQVVARQDPFSSTSR